MFAAVDWANLGIIVGGFATAAAVVGAPAAYFFHKKVVRPLKWVLGVPAEDSPDGKAIPPIPHQLANLRTDVLAIKSEMHPNGGSSMRDSLNRNELMTAQTLKSQGEVSERLEAHITEDAEVQAAINTTLMHALKQLKKGQKAAKYQAKALGSLAADEVALQTAERSRLRRYEEKQK